MLKSKLLAIYGLIPLACLSSFAHAEFIETDLLVQGDALSTLDTDSGLEWADFSLTMGMSIGEVQDKLNSDFQGWRLPTESEVKDLAFKMFGDVGFNAWGYYSGYHDNRAEWLSLFGSVSGKFGQTSWGLYETEQGDIWLTGADQSYLYDGYHYYAHGMYDNHAYAGVFLVNDGGLSLDSIANPELNASNPNSP